MQPPSDVPLHVWVNTGPHWTSSSVRRGLLLAWRPVSTAGPPGDWEGDGIAPDIAVDPTQALVVALEKAGVTHAEAVRLGALEVPAEPVHKDKLRSR